MKKWTRADVIKLAKQLEENDGYIDVIKLAELMDVDVYATKKDADFSAKITHAKNGRFSILVNEDHPETRRRFSIAHEISHFILDRPKIIASGSLDRAAEYKDEEEKKSEEKADSLAAELLMPRESVEKYFERNDITKATKFTAQMIVDVAEHFHVSRPMVITRLRKLGYAVPYIEFA